MVLVTNIYYGNDVGCDGQYDDENAGESGDNDDDYTNIDEGNDDDFIISQLPSKLRFSANCSFFGQSWALSSDIPAAERDLFTIYIYIYIYIYIPLVL